MKEEAEYLLAIAREGGSLFFNNFGPALADDTPEEDLMYLIHYICNRGYENRVLIGIDANFHLERRADR